MASENGNGLPDVPNPVVECAGCGENLSQLAPHLKVAVKAEVKVLLTQPIETDDPEEITGNQIILGSKSGRGRIFFVHDFDCLAQYAQEREGQTAKVQHHTEDEIYVPEDNRSPEELVEAGELPGAYLDYQSALGGGEE